MDAKFKAIDTSKSGEIVLDEFKLLKEIRLHPMRERIYELAREDMEAHNGSFKFGKFVEFLSVFHEKTPRI